eukprot:7965544-Alexandrium_andersonii.AAC.1
MPRKGNENSPAGAVDGEVPPGTSPSRGCARAARWPRRRPAEAATALGDALTTRSAFQSTRVAVYERPFGYIR